MLSLADMTQQSKEYDNVPGHSPERITLAQETPQHSPSRTTPGSGQNVESNQAIVLESSEDDGAESSNVQSLKATDDGNDSTPQFKVPQPKRKSLGDAESPPHKKTFVGTPQHFRTQSEEDVPATVTMRHSASESFSRSDSDVDLAPNYMRQDEGTAVEASSAADTPSPSPALQPAPDMGKQRG